MFTDRFYESMSQEVAFRPLSKTDLTERKYWVADNVSKLLAKFDYLVSLIVSIVSSCSLDRLPSEIIDSSSTY